MVVEAIDQNVDPTAVVRYLVLRDKEAGPQPGDIRYDIPAMLGNPIKLTENVIHASDKPESAIRKLKIYNKAKERARTQTQPQPQA